MSFLGLLMFCAARRPFLDLVHSPKSLLWLSLAGSANRSFQSKRARAYTVIGGGILDSGFWPTGALD